MLSKEPNDIIRDENYDIELVIYRVIGDRKNQEDVFGYLLENQKALIVISDGMGGLKQGKMASEFTTKMILDSYKAGKPFDYEAELLEPIRDADDQIGSFVDEEGQPIGAGCTIVGICIEQGRLNWASVGDSRAYLFRNGQYVQLTKDQNYKTYLDESLRAGVIDKKEYEKLSVKKDALINYIGMGTVRESGFIDFNEQSLKLSAGDVVLVMSDGVYKVLDNIEMNKIVMENSNIVDLAQTMEMRMVSKAEANRLKRDNTTLAVIRIK